MCHRLFHLLGRLARKSRLVRYRARVKRRVGGFDGDVAVPLLVDKPSLRAAIS